MARPNGLVITSAHDVLVAETLGNHVIAFQIGNDGALLHRRGVRKLREEEPTRHLCGFGRGRGRPLLDSRFLSACCKAGVSLIESMMRARIETTSIDVPGAASSMRFVEIISHSRTGRHLALSGRRIAKMKGSRCQ